MTASRSNRPAHTGRIAVTAVILAAVVIVPMGSYFFLKQPRSVLPSAPPPEAAATTDLGITYLPLTSGVSAYYDLGVDSGALITDIAPNSLADRAGLKAGDVILSYNGTTVEKGSPLIGVIKGCPVGSNIVMEVYRGKSRRTVSFVHSKS